MNNKTRRNAIEKRPLLYLINPHNPIERKKDKGPWSRLQIWPPLSLATVAGLTPDLWDVQILDENLKTFNYDAMPRPTLVGITACTCQAPRAYEVANIFRCRNVLVVMGGIHATMCTDEARQYVNSIVLGEAESVWHQVIVDSLLGYLQHLYVGTPIDWSSQLPARHDLLKGKYILGAIQTTRGCPLGCRFCSVTAFNGRRYRRRPIEDVISEMRSISNKLIIFADDNLIGTRTDHMEYAKSLFRSLIKQNIRKYWAAQVTINMADDLELLQLAKAAGCMGVYIGFESPNPKNLEEMNKLLNLRYGTAYYRDAVRRIHDAGIGVTGNFIIGFDQDKPGIAQMIVNTVKECQIDGAPFTVLTPLPGTYLYNQVKREGRISLTNYPKDWSYYNFAYPTFKFNNFSWLEIEREGDIIYQELLKSRINLLVRFFRTLFNTKDLRVALLYLLSNLSYRRNWHIYSSRPDFLRSHQND